MRAAAANNVERVVITSSVASIMLTKDSNRTHFTDDDWTDMSIADPYSLSKTKAEKAAWDFVGDLQSKGQKMDIVTINPGLIMGTPLVTAQFTSADFIKGVLTNEIGALPKVCTGVVDVEDVAKAHL